MQNSKRTIPYKEKYIHPILRKRLSGSGRTCNVEVAGRNRRMLWLLSLCALIFFGSCSTPKNSVYFTGLPRDTTLRNIVTENYDLKIQKNDLLGIAVASLSPDVAFYNAPQNTVGGANGYLVDQYGNISFVKLGTLHVEGMTRKQLKDTLQNGLVPYLRDAVVSVGFLNRHITLMGAVSPQVLPMPGDNMTILDALAASGDIGEKGRIDNILVIRDHDGAKDFKRLNLKSDSIFYSPYYYLQPNDIVYVEPRKVKQQLTVPQAVSYITSAISLFFLISRL